MSQPGWFHPEGPPIGPTLCMHDMGSAQSGHIVIAAKPAGSQYYWSCRGDPQAGGHWLSLVWGGSGCA